MAWWLLRSPHTQRQFFGILAVLVETSTRSLTTCCIGKCSFRSGRVDQRISAQIVDVPLPEIQKHIVEVVKITPQERDQQRTVEQTVDVPVQQIMETNAEVVQLIPLERVSERVVEQIVDVPVLPIWERFPPRCSRKFGHQAEKLIFPRVSPSSAGRLRQVAARSSSKHEEFVDPPGYLRTVVLIQSLVHSRGRQVPSVVWVSLATYHR